MEASLGEGQANHTENKDNSSAIEKQSRCAWLRPFLSPLLQSFFIQFMTGLNDGNLGITLPHIKDHYVVYQTVISTVFLCYASGFAIAALLDGMIITKLTQAKTMMIGALALVIGFAMVFMALPFPALCVFYVFIGFGVALTQSGANVFVGELPKATMMLNFLHGALLGPFIASALLQHRSWNYTYLVLASFAVNDRRKRICTEPDLEATTVELRKSENVSEKNGFKDNNQQSLDKLRYSSLRCSSINSIQSNHSSASGTTAVSYIEENNNSQDKEKNSLAQVICYRVAYIGCFYLLVYVGIEVTIGDWAYTADLCIGRLCLGYITLKCGEKQMVYIYISILICMCAIFWAIPIIAVSSVALLLSGIALGPLFPTMLSLASQCVPCYLYATCVGFLCAFGSGGSAIFPYLTGVLIDGFSVKIIPPLTLAMSLFILAAWFLIPNSELGHRNYAILDLFGM
ncbi:hypothetical protein INT45_002692, partial [Circinella minor]